MGRNGGARSGKEWRCVWWEGMEVRVVGRNGGACSGKEWRNDHSDINDGVDLLLSEMFKIHQ